MHFSTKSAVALAALAALGLTAARPAAANSTPVTINFDDVDATGGIVPISGDYHGYLFSNTDISNPATDFAPHAVGLVSAPNVAFNYYFGALTISSDDSSAFAFTSGYFAAFDTANPTSTLTITGSRNGITTGSENVTISSLSPTYVSLDQSIFGSVDSVSLNNDPDALIMDNLQFNGAPVPEASTTVSFGLLLALGLGTLTAAKRKKVQ